MSYLHGVGNSEVATSLTTPTTSSAGLQVIFGTAPIHLAKDPYKAANTPKLCYSFAECQEALGYSDDFENFTLCQSMDANFRVYNNSPIVLVNVLDPNKAAHTTENAEETVTVTGGKVTNVAIDASGETPELGGAAAETLADELTKAGSTNGVDAVSGATMTSEAVFTAMDDCLSQAQ